MKKNNIFLILAVLISSVGIISLLHTGFFLTDDGNSMVIRFSSFYETLRAGELPVRFLSRLNFSYGYPVSDFLYPLFMYIGVPIHVLGFSFVDTIKIIFGLSFLSGTIFSYLWLKKIFDEKSALVGSVAYSLFPYHLFDIYKRGSVGEVLALGIVPFILWSIEIRNVFLISVGYALLITGHNSLALIFIPIIFIYSLFKTKFIQALFPLSVGLCLSSFFWIPALYDKQFTIFDITKVSNYQYYFMNIQSMILVGIVFFVAIIFSAVFLVKKDKYLIYFFLLALISLAMSLPLSDFVWKILPLQTLIQFPFRFLSITILAVAFLLSYLVFKYKGKIKTIFILFILSTIFISAKDFIIPAIIQSYPDSFYSTNQDSTTVKNEYMPKWVKVFPQKMPDSKIENLSGSEKINVKEVKPNKISFLVFLPTQRTIKVNTVYFPGWIAYVNGIEKPINYQNSGLIELNLDKGQNNVLIVFRETSVRLFADFLSLASFIFICVFSYKRKSKV